jgi:hypothetical protein
MEDIDFQHLNYRIILAADGNIIKTHLAKFCLSHDNIKEGHLSMELFVKKSISNSNNCKLSFFYTIIDR